METVETGNFEQEKLSLNLAIVGGGRTCKAFLDLIRKDQPSYLDINVLGVCEINSTASGLATAREMGLYTTDRLSEVLNLPGIDAVLELTNNQALADIMAQKPADVAIIEHNAGRLLETFFSVSRKLASAKKRIALERRSYEVLFQQSNIGIVVLTPDFAIVDANRAYLTAVNNTREAAIGKPCHEIVKGFFAPCSYAQMGFECPVVQTLRTGQSAFVIHEYEVSENQTSYFNIAAYPIKDAEGNIVRIIELWREITKEISSRWEKQVQRLEKDMKKTIQEDRMISLGRLVASCVHEINNPIQGLLTLGHLIQENLREKPAPDPSDVAEMQRHLQLMTGELERCGDIISGLLSFSRESAIEFKEEDLNDILNAVIALTRHKMKLGDIVLETHLSTEPLYIVGDKNQLQQCVLNLIFNAIEAMPDGGKLVVRSSREKNHRIRVVIRDTGCGISEKDLHYIFDPFFTTREEGAGIGLGLSIVYGMVKSHKGDIAVESRLGEGTAFILTFPGA